jgi:hypothetical protein
MLKQKIKKKTEPIKKILAGASSETLRRWGSSTPT